VPLISSSKQKKQKKSKIFLGKKEIFRHWYYKSQTL
jgi:hypothetical protein